MRDGFTHDTRYVRLGNPQHLSKHLEQANVTATRNDWVLVAWEDLDGAKLQPSGDGRRHRRTPACMQRADSMGS